MGSHESSLSMSVCLLVFLFGQPCLVVSKEMLPVTFRTQPPSFWLSGCYNSPTPLLQCSLSVRVRSCVLDLSAGAGLPTATCPLHSTSYDIVQWSPSMAKESFFDGGRGGPLHLSLARAHQTIAFYLAITSPWVTLGSGSFIDFLNF